MAGLTEHIEIPEYHEISISSTSYESEFDEAHEACLSLVEAIHMREKYMVPRRREVDFPEQREFIAKVKANPYEPQTAPIALPKEVYENDTQWDRETGLIKIPDCGVESKHTYESYAEDLDWLYHSCVRGKAENTFCAKRLCILTMSFDLHLTLNEHLEDDSVVADSADFPSIKKVDNHIHAAGSMTEIEVLRFIKEKMETEPDLVVNKEGRTLREVLSDSGIDSSKMSDLTTERLGMKADSSMFHRFDHFNDAYNPFGATDLRTIFMKTSNFIDGRFFAEIIKDTVLKRCSHKSSTNQCLEPRLSIYGFGMKEYADLSHFFVEHKLQPDTDCLVKWQIQVPRLCNIFMGSKYQNFGELMENIFNPIVQATLYPEKYPDIHIFLSHIGGFDSVDDESNFDECIYRASNLSPYLYTSKKNPPYSYWMFFMSENIKLINRLREMRGLNTFSFAPHCGEAGQRHHCASAFLVADSINHGIKIAASPVFKYLYYCVRLGMALCPMSNDKLFVRLKDSPIGEFQKIGLNISLNTDDPLQFHQTNDPLLEEYLISSKTFDFSVHDLCEIAYNSVQISNFDHESKVKMLGRDYLNSNEPRLSNDTNYTNVSRIRSDYRIRALRKELAYLYCHACKADEKSHSSSKTDNSSTFFRRNSTKLNGEEVELAGIKFPLHHSKLK